MSTRRLFSRGTGLMRAVVPNGKGGVTIENRQIPIPKEDEVLIKVEAVGVNRADLLQVEGKYPPPPGTTDILGLEAAGYLEDGNPVAALLTGGGFAEYVAAPKNTILRFPSRIDNLKMIELAAIPEAFLAAHHVLFQKGMFTANQTVLINAAASGVGTSAIQLAKTVTNASVIASASTQEKLSFCRMLGADHVVNYTEKSISEAVREVTGGAGVDLVLDCVGAEQFKENERSLKTDGRWVMYGLLSGAKNPQLGLAGIVSKRLTVCGTTLRSQSKEYRGKLARAFSEQFGSAFEEDGQLRPVIDRVFVGLESTEEALRYVRNNRNKGKVIVQIHDMISGENSN